MKFASGDLVSEHDGILRGIAILENMTAYLAKNRHVDVDDIRDIIDFFLTFADKCHHAKEENLFFPALRNNGHGEKHQLIAELIREHEEAGKFLSAMQSAFQVNAFDTHIFRRAAENYARIIRSHIERENAGLFPFADKVIPPEMQSGLLEQFEEFETRSMGKGTHEKFHQLLERLERAYVQSD